MYDAAAVTQFYDQYGESEWQRLDSSAHARLIFHLHMKFLEDHIGPGRKVADIGCGGGRFSVAIAQSGSEVMLVDLSPEQIRVAEARMAESGLEELVTDYIVGDICNLQPIDDGIFDTVVCYGGVLSYLLERLPLGLAELKRITRPGGTIVISVNSRWGLLRFAVANPKLEPAGFFGDPEYWKIFEVAGSGDLPRFDGNPQPPRHFFEASELAATLTESGIRVVAMGTAPASGAMLYDRLAAIEETPAAWRTLLRLEELAFQNPGLLDSGEFLMARCTV
jgi:ubiquinone/menaquinone biosynthesis C-methylase UbiE